MAALFQDLAVLVQHQSEMLDSIEENVETAGACLVSVVVTIGIAA